MSAPQKKNIIVCGYPKSGTTFSTRLVAQLLSCPSTGFWGFHGDTFVTEGQERESDLICYQSHHPYEDLTRVSKLPIHKIIYVVRDPRDIVVSGAFHFSFFRATTLKWLNLIRPKKAQILVKKFFAYSKSRRYNINRMLGMLESGDPLIDHAHWAWDFHLDSYMIAPDVLILRYEDLIQKGPETARKVLEYGGVTKTEAQIASDLEAQSFKQRKSDFQNANDKLKDRHLRKGVAGDWKNHLTESDCERIKARFGKLMHKLGYL